MKIMKGTMKMHRPFKNGQRRSPVEGEVTAGLMFMKKIIC